MEKDLDETKAPADDPAVLEQFAQLSRVGIGTDIKIFGGFAKEKVPDPATDQISGKAGVPQTIKDFQGFTIDAFPGDGVLVPGNDLWWRQIDRHIQSTALEVLKDETTDGFRILLYIQTLLRRQIYQRPL